MEMESSNKDGPELQLLVSKCSLFIARGGLQNFFLLSRFDATNRKWALIDAEFDDMNEVYYSTSQTCLHQNHPEGRGLLKHRLLGTTPRVCELVDLGWGLRKCISNKFLGNTDAAGWRTTALL